jgi:hypothetical protein
VARSWYRGRGLGIGEGSVHRLDHDRTSLVQAEAAELPEDRVGRALPEIELDRVAVRPARRPRQHHQVQHARIRGERVDQTAGYVGRARDAYMQHRKIVGRPAAVSITQPE